MAAVWQQHPVLSSASNLRKLLVSGFLSDSVQLELDLDNICTFCKTWSKPCCYLFRVKREYSNCVHMVETIEEWAVSSYCCLCLHLHSWHALLWAGRLSHTFVETDYYVWLVQSPFGTCLFRMGCLLGLCKCSGAISELFRHISESSSHSSTIYCHFFVCMCVSEVGVFVSTWERERGREWAWRVGRECDNGAVKKDCINLRIVSIIMWW